MLCVPEREEEGILFAFMLITFAGQEDRHFFAELQTNTVFLTCKCFSCFFIHSRMCQADRNRVFHNMDRVFHNMEYAIPFGLA